jgi:hypothetical protein
MSGRFVGIRLEWDNAAWFAKSLYSGDGLEKKRGGSVTFSAFAAQFYREVVETFELLGASTSEHVHHRISLRRRS